MPPTTVALEGTAGPATLRARSAVPVSVPPEVAVEARPLFITPAEQAVRQKKEKLKRPNRNCERRLCMTPPNRPIGAHAHRSRQVNSPAHTPRVSAHMRRSVCHIGQTRECGYGSCASLLVRVLGSTGTALLTTLRAHNEAF